MVFAKITLMLKSEKGKVVLREIDSEWFLGEYFCVPLDSIVPFFYGSFY